MRRISQRNLGVGLVSGGVLAFIAILRFTFVPPPWVVLALACTIIAGGLLFALDSVGAARHRKEMAEFALLHGWSHTAMTRAYAGRFDSFPFATGTDRWQGDMLSGTYAGVDCATFTHHFTVDDSGSGKVEQEFQVTLVELPVVLPRIELVPEGLAAKFSKALGGRDLDVESAEFNRRWRVLCSNPRYAHAVLDPRMVERLLEPDTWDMAIRIEGGAVMAWQAERQGPESLARRLGVLAGVARRIPAHVVREYRDMGAVNVRGEDRTIPSGAPDWATTPGALTSGKATGIEPAPFVKGSGYGELTGAEFDIFNPRTWI